MTKPEKKALVPALRFPEFQNMEEWEEKTLDDVAVFFKGKGISKSDIDLQGDVPCIRYGELYTIYGEIINTVHSKTKLPTSELFLSQKNDVLIPSSGETKIDIAKASCILFDGVALGSDLNVLRSNEDGVFLSYMLNGVCKRDIAKKAQGDAVVHLYSSQLKLLDILVPKEQEQQKIADCLSSIDDLITAQTQKLAALKAHKKGLMQQLFPAEGETVPKLRFPEFRDGGEWRRLKLVDVAEFIDSLHETPTQYVESGYPMIRVADVKDSGLDLANCLKVTEDVYIHFVKRYKPKKGDIIFSRVGSCGESVLIDFEEKICLGQNTVLIKAKESSVYLFFYLKSKLIRNQVNNKVVGSSHKTLSLKDAKNFEVFIPSETEQQKIADCLSSVDDLITAQGEKIEALKSHKKGLMQQLFPSMDEDNHPPPAAYPSRGGELRDEPFPSSGGVDSEAGRGGSPPTTGRGD